MTAPVIPVSPAEKAVLDELMRDGATNVAIGERLGISEHTVKSHMKRLLAGFDLPSRTALAVSLFRGRYRIRVDPQPTVHRQLQEDAA